MLTPKQETLGQMMRRLERIADHVEKLPLTERDWLMRRLAEAECRDTQVGQVWTTVGVPAR